MLVPSSVQPVQCRYLLNCKSEIPFFLSSMGNYSEGVQGDASPEALAWGVPHRHQLKGNTPPQGVQGFPCRGLGCPQKPLFFSFSLGAKGSKREREGVFKGHRPLDPLKLTPMGVSPHNPPFSACRLRRHERATSIVTIEATLVREGHFRPDGPPSKARWLMLRYEGKRLNNPRCGLP